MIPRKQSTVVRRFLQVVALAALGAGLLAVALPLGGVRQDGAYLASAGLLVAVLILAVIAGYIGSSLGAVLSTVVAGLAGPQLAVRYGPTPDAEFISLFSVPVLLLPVLFVAAMVGTIVKGW